MNLFFKSYRVLLFFFTLICFETCSIRGFAQITTIYPIPWIQEIELPDHYAEIPNTSFYLGPSGELFLGKENGLTVVRKSGIQHLHFPGPVYVCGNQIDSVFYACENDLGFLIRDREDRYVLKSIRERIPRSHREFTPFQILNTDHGLFLNSDKGIIRLIEGRIEPVTSWEGEAKLFLRENELLRWLTGEGFSVWKGKTFEACPVPGPDPVPGSPSGTLLGFLSPNRFLTLKEGTGIVVTDSAGIMMGMIGNNKGLPDHDIRQIHMSEGDELWVLGTHSLHNINFPSSLATLDIDPMQTGRIFASSVSTQGIFLGTNHGLFLAAPDKETGGRWQLEKLFGNASFHLMDREGNRMFAAGGGSLVSYDPSGVTLLAEGSFTGLKSVGPGKVVASGPEGINLYSIEGGSWKASRLDPPLFSAHSFALHQEMLFFLSGNHVYHLTAPFEKIHQVPFHREELLLRFIPMGRDLFLITDAQVYSYDPGEETFLPLEKDPQSSDPGHFRYHHPR